jgi:hypothetical protein
VASCVGEPLKPVARAGSLLTITTLQANTDAEISPSSSPPLDKPLASLRGDPLPQTVLDIAAVFIEALGHAEGARTRCCTRSRRSTQSIACWPPSARDLVGTMHAHRYAKAC